VPRPLATVLVLALLAATAAAFAVTEGLKLERTPIFGTQVDKIFSPACNCDKAEAAIDFKLRKRERLTVWIERDGDRVATIVPGKNYPVGKVALAFDGFANTGRLLPDGTYVPVVHLGRSHRTIRLPNPIVLDTTPPVVSVRHPLHAVISPDRDGRKDRFTVPYKLNERAHGILYVNDRRVQFTRGQKETGELVWNGRFDGHAVRPRNYILSIAAQDTAGNVSKPTPFAVVQVRYISLGRKRVLAKPATHFAIRVSTDTPTVRWRLAGGTGTARRGTLRLRAPRNPGVYTLYVTANGHSAKASVVVA
jgi:hypothetical protein